MSENNSVDATKEFLLQLVLDLINSKSERTDFQNLIDSLSVVGFEDQYIDVIRNQATLHEIKYPMIEKKSKKTTRELTKSKKKRIFIVHGHNVSVLDSLARLLEKQELKPIILKEQPSEGLTLLEKFEANADSDFAIILLTGDDKANQKDSEVMNLRARQNVIFEMGYFFALLGRENVACLQEEGIEVPSDIAGRMYINLDRNGSWKLTLIKELRHAGFDVTADKL